MKLLELMQNIESSKFSAHLNVVSGFSVLQLALKHDETLRAAIEELQKSPQGKKQILDRLIELLDLNDHPEYAHPYDAAITSYLYVLSQTDNELADQAIEHILQTPRLWWASKLAKYLQENIATKLTVVNYGNLQLNPKSLSRTGFSRSPIRLQQKQAAYWAVSTASSKTSELRRGQIAYSLSTTSKNKSTKVKR